MQDNDAVVPQVAQGSLDVAHDLVIGVEPIDWATSMPRCRKAVSFAKKASLVVSKW